MNNSPFETHHDLGTVLFNFRLPFPFFRLAYLFCGI